MFRIRHEFYEDKETFPGKDKELLSKILDPRTFHDVNEKEGNLPEDLGDLLNQTANKTQFRNPILFSTGTYPLAKPIDEGTYNLKLDLSRPHNGEYASEPTNTKVIVTHDDKKTILFSINPENNTEKKLLQNLKRNEEGQLISDEYNKLELRSQKAKHNIHTNLMTDYDPEEIIKFNQMWNLFNFGIGNNKLTQNYFMQMASLFLTGSFADMSNSRLYSGIKGLLPNNSSQIISIATNLGEYTGWNNRIIPPSEKEKELFKQIMAQDIPWYHNEKFKNNINIGKVIHTCNRLGSAFRKDEEDSAVNIVAIATENLVSEVYESLTGKHCNGEEFIEKLKYINKNIQDAGILDPYIGIYTDKKTNPANIRGEMIHVGTYRSNENSAAYYWAAEFYIDLSKTLLSAVANKGQQYLEFDHYARKTELVHAGKNSVAYVPINMQTKK